MNPATISRLAKSRYLLKFSEDDFRDMVVRPLLLLKGLKDGRDLCGPTEQGKDALFYEVDRLEALRLIAVQTKKGTLNLAAKASQNIVDIVAQLRTAAQTSYAMLTPVRMKKKPSQVILISSGKINEAARKHIVEEVGDTTIYFLDSDDIIPWIDALIPHIWLDINTNVATYVAALEKQLVGGEGPFARQFLPTDPSVASTCFQDDAVSLQIRRANDLSIAKKRGARSVRSSKKVREDAVFPLHALQTKPFKRVLILGDGGEGKTFGLLQMAYRTAKAGLESGSFDSIPVLVKATDLVQAASPNLADHIEQLSRGLTVEKTPAFGLKELNSGKVCVFIDGLDEVGLQKNRNSVANLALDFSTAYPKCLVIITSRPYEYLAEIDGLQTFERFSVVPISWKDAEKIISITKRQGADSERMEVALHDKARETLSHLSQIQGFNLNPLMVSVYAQTTNFDHQDVPPNITELFKRFTEQMLGRWDELRGLKNLHKPMVKDYALQSLAFSMHERRITKIAKAEAVAIIQRKLEELGHRESADGILAETIERSSLFRDFGEDIGFRHHLFQEFFAGRGMGSSGVVSDLIDDSWWRRSIVFHYGENPQNAQELQTYLRNMADRPAVEQLIPACTVGLALQACYLSPVVVKINIWKLLIERLVDIRDACVESTNGFKLLPIFSFFGYLFNTRDSVALSNLVAQTNVVLPWLESFDAAEKDLAMALFCLALMRGGNFDIISEKHIDVLTRDPAYCAIAAFEIFEAVNYRPLPEKQKRIAEVLEKRLEPIFMAFLPKVLKELETNFEIGVAAESAIAERTRGDDGTAQLLIAS